MAPDIANIQDLAKVGLAIIDEEKGYTFDLSMTSEDCDNYVRKLFPHFFDILDALVKPSECEPTTMDDIHQGQDSDDEGPSVRSIAHSLPWVLCRKDGRKIGVDGMPPSGMRFKAARGRCTTGWQNTQIYISEYKLSLLALEQRSQALCPSP